MYLAVDIGGTKTLLAAFYSDGTIKQQIKFPTPPDYDDFLLELETNIKALGVDDYKSACVASPGLIDREEGIGIAYGNLAWQNVPIGPDLERLAGCPVVVENDANLAGLSEAQLIKKEFNKVLYVTLSTGIGTGVITNGKINPSFLNAEGGKILLEKDGHLKSWESFASGKAIKKKYGMRASEINDPKIWKAISRDIAIGLVDNIAIIQPDAIVIGGGVGAHFQKFKAPLLAEMRKYDTPLVPTPAIRQAVRSEEAVIYGCYLLARESSPLK